jgi:plastocyanin
MNRRLALALALPLLAMSAGAVFSVPAAASLRQIAVGNFYFDDETVGDGTVVAQVGDQLRFSVLDGGPGTPHTVDVDELGIHSGSLGSGETFTTPPISKAGTFVLYCKPHDQRGHKATLVVGGTSITTATTVSSTTTTAPGTSTTSKPTATTKSPATTTTTQRAAGVPASSATTTRPVTTTISPGTTSTVGGTGAAGPTGADPGTGSTTTTETTPAGSAPVQGAGIDADDEASLVPVGRGTVGDGFGPAPGSFDELLNRRFRGGGPWTRSIRLSLAGLVPMALAAGVAIHRSASRRRENDEGEPLR